MAVRRLISRQVSRGERHWAQAPRQRFLLAIRLLALVRLLASLRDVLRRHKCSAESLRNVSDVAWLSFKADFRGVDIKDHSLRLCGQVYANGRVGGYEGAVEI